MRLFVSKHALRDGVIVEKTLCPYEGDSGLTTFTSDGCDAEIFRLGVDVFKTRQEAVRAASAERDAHVDAHFRRIRELQALRFDATRTVVSAADRETEVSLTGEPLA